MSQMSRYANRTPSGKRRHALSVLNPGGTITYAHLDRAVDLAVRYELNLALVSDRRRAAACSATPRLKRHRFMTMPNWRCLRTNSAISRTQ